jgi:LPXTG-motif cell wall-anchored protein
LRGCLELEKRCHFVSGSTIKLVTVHITQDASTTFGGARVGTFDSGREPCAAARLIGSIAIGTGTMLKVGIALLAGATLAVGSAILGVGSAVAAPDDVCVPTNLWFNTGGSSKELYEYSPAGVQLFSVALNPSSNYGDIGFDANGTLYAIQFTAVNPKIVILNTTTGVATAGVTVTGIVSGVSYNALSALPNGNLLLGSSYLSTIYEVNPATGVATLYDTYPTGVTSAGDFVGLAGGDILAIANQGAATVLFRIHPNLTMTEVGTVPAAYGAAESANVVYLAGANGDIYSLNTIPTAPSTAALTPDATVSTGGLGFYGASSVQDANGAACGVPPTITSAAPAAGGVRVPYHQTVSASGSTTIVFATTTGVLPAGLSLDPNTGVISGVPTTVGSYTYTVTASNDFGTASATYTTTISDTLPTTGVDTGFPLSIAAMALLFGVGLLGWSRRRGRKSRSAE